MRKPDLRAVPTAFVVLASLCWAALAGAADLPRAAPESVGLSSPRLDRITAMLADNVKAQAIPGAVLLIARHGKIAYLHSAGERDPAAKAPMAEDAIFRIEPSQCRAHLRRAAQ